MSFTLELFKIIVVFITSFKIIKEIYFWWDRKNIHMMFLSEKISYLNRSLFLTKQANNQ